MIHAHASQSYVRRTGVRTREGLARAKARGVKLGGANEQSAFNQEQAQTFAKTVRPHIQAIIAEHGTDVSATKTAAALNRRRVATAIKGADWHAQQVIRVMRRLGLR